MTAAATAQDWKATRLKYVADCNERVLPESTPEDYEFTYIDIGSVGQGTMDTDGQPVTFADAPSRARRLAEPGDTIISTVRTYLRAVATVPEVVEKALVFSTGFAVLHPRGNVSRRFLSYVLQGDDFVDKVVATSVGVSYPAITATDLMALDLRIPPLEEQRAIADLLDRETAQIDVLVAKQEEFIGYLRERRWVAIASIFARAQDSASPDRLHRRTRMGNGSTPKSDEDRYWVDGDIPWVNSSVVNRPEVTKPSRLLTETAVKECHLPMVRRGSILIALTGQGKTRGAATILRIDSTINQHLAFIEADERYWVPEYLLWLLRSNYDHLRRISSENGATKGGLTVGALRHLRLVMPPISDQLRLLHEVETTEARINALIAKAQEHIALANERRSALITAAVTGRFDLLTIQSASKAG